MRLLLQELRKIWRPGILAVLVLLGALYYHTFLSFEIQYFPNGIYDAAQLELAAGWAARYGPTIEPAELAGLKLQREEAAEAFRKAVAARPECAGAGITDYESYLAYRDETYQAAERNGGQVDMERERLIQQTAGSTNYALLQELDTFLRMYAQQEAGIPAHLGYRGEDDPPELRRLSLARADSVAAGGWRHGFLPIGVLDATGNYCRGLAVWMLLSTVLLLSPVLVRDRLSRMRSLQWASRQGRRILTVQMAAALLSGCLLPALNLAVFGGIFLGCNGVLAFKDCGLFSVWALQIPWFDWTYGQYLLALGGVLSALSLAAAGLTCFLSRFSAHYVAMLLKALPLFAALTGCSRLLLTEPFFLGNPLGRLLVLPGAEGLAAAALTAAVLLLCLFDCRMQRRRELLQP